MCGVELYSFFLVESSLLPNSFRVRPAHYQDANMHSPMCCIQKHSLLSSLLNTRLSSQRSESSGFSAIQMNKVKKHYWPLHLYIRSFATTIAYSRPSKN